ncbi:hypothetical protein PU629_08685 [Pullulanibacillus sp. KACC 23026]|uniref:hypothetical protein n=1 Tax=Pullulanibacillus sp. KACC 23026 TaxID=3028315 RepID=UPI0023B033F4|nr:hypothetical protein [Pullulanibacillus sp. KACC 23026]WEG14417.1 hypothetical protein PU629_08685 [Pullulanibacillus sp. KACC 23026]
MLNQGLLQELQNYIDKRFALSATRPILCNEPFLEDIQDYIKTNRRPAFNQLLLNLIDQKGYSDPTIYKKAGIDRRHFSKIRSNSNYRPGKDTIISLALALELTLEEAEDLLSSVGYSFSDSEPFDLAIQFCIERQIYKLDDVNLALDHLELKVLGD